MSGKKTRLIVAVLIAINILIFTVHPEFIKVRLSPYKNLSLFLRYPGAEHLKTYYNSFSRIDTLKSPAVRFAPGLSLTYLDPLPEQAGLSTDGNRMNAVTSAGSKEALRFLEYLPSALAYEIVKMRKNIKNDKSNLPNNFSEPSLKNPPVPQIIPPAPL